MRLFTPLRAAIAAGLLLLSPHLAAQTIDSERAALLDAHAIAAPAEAEASAASLARYLTSVTKNDTEKARVLYRWIADRIDYDVDAYLANKLQTQAAADVLKSRTSVCNGYAALFETLGREAGLEIVTILGYAKGYKHPAGQTFAEPNHAWNAIKIDGRWRLLDSTWGAGHVEGGKYQKVLSEAYFLAPPEQLLFSHFPQEAAWQLQSTARLSKSEFESLPTVEATLFHTGISGEEVWRTLESANFNGTLVHTFDVPYGMVKVKEAPLPYQLKAEQALHFKIQSEAFEAMALLLDGKWTALVKSDGVFGLDYIPKDRGELMVMGKKPDSADYMAVLAYSVN